MIEAAPECEDESRRDLSSAEFVSACAYDFALTRGCKTRSTKNQCLPVRRGATAKGRKELIAV